MVGPIQTYHPSLIGIDLGHLQCQIISLGPRITKCHHGQLLGEPPQQLLRRLRHHIIEEPGVSLEDFGLLLDSPDELRMAVSDMRHIIDTVEVLLAVLFVHDDALGVGQLQGRGVVGNRQGWV